VTGRGDGVESGVRLLLARSDYAVALMEKTDSGLRILRRVSASPDDGGPRAGRPKEDAMASNGRASRFLFGFLAASLSSFAGGSGDHGLGGILGSVALGR
jgi:hypothetical protein